jgi:hypothetical protein
MVDTTSILTPIFCLIFAVLFFGLPALFIVFVVGLHWRASTLLYDWAARNGYRIIESERRRYRKGPFFFTSSNQQVVFRVTVQDVYGNVRQGWVRCGSYNLGTWTNDVDFRFDN